MVERRYSEFDALRSKLVKWYPGIVIIQLPNKTLKQKVEKNFVEKRKIALQKFLDAILSEPTIRSNEVVKAFITLPGKEWEAKAKTQLKLPSK